MCTLLKISSSPPFIYPSFSSIIIIPISHNELLMRMSSMRYFFNGFLSLFLLIHLGCFAIFSSNNPNSNPDYQEPQPKRRKVIPTVSPATTSTASHLKPQKSFSILSYLNNLLSFRNKTDYNLNNITSQSTPPPQQQPTSWPLTLSPNHLTTSSPQLLVSSNNNNHIIPLTKQSSFGSRNDIFPCTVCGEVLSRPHHLELHQATKHSLCELHDSDSGKNIVQIIFRSGWKGSKSPPPAIHRILKIHNTLKTVTRFEEYREIVRSRAEQMSKVTGVDERCIVDGNERLRFHCTTILCPLGSSTQVGACGSHYCRACGIVRHGFIGKQVDLDGIMTQKTSWGAHASLPEDLEREFAYLHVRRAMFVCRVVAGRVAPRGGVLEEDALLFDSVVPMDDELLVFNPRALLPCFLIIYSSK